MRRLRKELGPVRADLFAYPFSADGSWQTNDRADPRLPRRRPPRRASARSSSDGHPRQPPRTAQRSLERKEVNTHDDGRADLYAWLRPSTRARGAVDQHHRP